MSFSLKTLLAKRNLIIFLKIGLNKVVLNYMNSMSKMIWTSKKQNLMFHPLRNKYI